jgi:hypothetical protein
VNFKPHNLTKRKKQNYIMRNFTIYVNCQTLLRGLGGKCNNYRMIRNKCSILYGKFEEK